MNVALKIAVLGGTGFVGRALIERLVADGHAVAVVSRGRARHAERLLAPGVAIRECDEYDPAALERALDGHDVAINLVGILNDPGIGDSARGFERAHVELTRILIGACKAAGISRLLQMSALNAGRGSSHYLRTRGAAEELVKASGLDWSILQPSVIFGPGDGLFGRFAALLKLAPVLPLARASTKFAPVYLGDVVEAFARALRDETTLRQTYELYGPDVLTLAQIVRATARQLGLHRLVVPLPDVLGRLQAFAMDFVPGKPFSSDNYRSLLTDSVGGIDGLHRLGIVPTRIAAILPDILGHGEDRQARLDSYRARY
ncbi:MAG TPA: complex I NDUFA9 subunit family protein [Xanthomonadaceae bacterium]|nr:complex I NDUFA9 subunit family protein [Xanthomonadaceae bacterium]